MSEAISDYELESERKHNDSAVKHEEYDSDTEELFEKLEALERDVAEVKRQIKSEIEHMKKIVDLYSKKKAKP
jgi:hypothetical protein